MQMPNQIITKSKTVMFAVGLMTLALGLVIGLLSQSVSALSVTSVSSNVAEVPSGESFKLRVAASTHQDLRSLELDFSFDIDYPEFHVYALEANPYGNDAQRAIFEGYGVEVTYSEASSEWVIDFGDAITQDLVDRYGTVTIYLALQNMDQEDVWGSMYDVTEENTFVFDLVEGTGDEFAVEAEDSADEEVIIPGVPNTSFVY